ncbi:unnamed protein product, partial [Musa acuminata subsp. burmannicoides]
EDWEPRPPRRLQPCNHRLCFRCPMHHLLNWASRSPREAICHFTRSRSSIRRSRPLDEG